MGEETAEPLWEAKTTPLFYVLFRFDQSIPITLAFLVFLFVIANPERAPNNVATIASLAFFILVFYSLLQLIMAAWRSTSVLYQFDGEKLIERLGKRTKETSLPHYAVANSRNYCAFGHCCFHFQQKIKPPFSGPGRDIRFAPKMFMRTDGPFFEADSGRGIYGIRKEDADRLQEVLQTLEV